MVVVNVKINGKKISKEVADNTILADLLRDRLALTGTHVGCDTSQCGACVVHLDGNSIKRILQSEFNVKQNKKLQLRVELK